MKTLDELRQFFDTTLLPDLQKLEQERKQVLQRLLYVEGGILLFSALLFLLLNPASENGAPWVFVVGGIGMAVAFVLLVRKYQSKFKDVVIASLVSFFDPSLCYEKNGFIPRELYFLSRIFLHSVDDYNGDDFVKGRLGETDIQFSELHTEYEVETTDEKGNRSTESHTIFKGLFFVGDFNKHFKGRTVVLPDAAEKMLGGFGKFLQSKNFTRDPLVKMDDPEFEREFVVYGTDQIEVRYILSPSLMRRIVEFQQKTRKKVFLSFVNSKVFVAVSYKKNLFETNVFKTLLDFAPIEEYFNDLQTALGIVEELNLNTRIWSKE